MRRAGKIVSGGGFARIDGKTYSYVYRKGKPVVTGITGDEFKHGVESVFGKGWVDDDKPVSNDEKDKREDQCEQS